MRLELEGKIVIVTGGSKGIGRATALGFLAEGASVLVCARCQESMVKI
jgi:3-oxoacyl-[acyl-carrier protein] reductase